MNPTFLSNKGYIHQTSHASSSVSLHDIRPNPRQYDSYESVVNNDLPEPILPWMKSESRQSLGSRTSVDTASLHVVKRQFPNPSVKKKQRWSKHKWWLLFSNTLVIIIIIIITTIAHIFFFFL